MLQLWQHCYNWASPQLILDEQNASLQEQENLRRGRLLATLIAVRLPIYMILLPISLLPYPFLSYFFGVVICLLMQILSVVPNRKGRVRDASLLFLTGIFLGCAIGLWYTPPTLLPLCAPIYSLFAIAVVEAGLLLGRRAPYLCALMACAIISTHVYQNAPLLLRLPGFIHIPVFVIVFLPGFILTILAMLASIGEASMEQAILHVHKVGQEHERLEAHHEAMTEQAGQLTEMNTQLLAVQAQLEAKYLALETANSQLAALATTDGMTGLSNHRAFHEELTHQIARVARSRAPLALMLLDVDFFKQYNDSFGHPAGDEVLKSVAEVLTNQVREGDYPARYGGEEFAVVLQDTDAETAEQVAERIRLAVESYPFPNRQVTVSIGVALYTLGEEADAMVQRADVALYEAKSAGRNRVIYIAAEGGERDHTVSTAETNLIETSEASNKQEKLAFAMQESLRETTGSFMTDDFYCVPDYSPYSIIQLLGGLEGLLQESPTPILLALIDIMDRRGVESWGHSVRVTRYALRLSNAVITRYETLRPTRPLLPRMHPGDLADLAFGALLHDIGKMGIPDGVLRKQGKLTDDEWRQIRRHPLAGAELIADNAVLARALPVIRSHHERWDGLGYPQGLRGEAIPLVARIFAVCDTFDTITVSRAYRNRIDFAEAREEIARGAGTQFDPDIVDAFMTVSEAEWRHLASPWMVSTPQSPDLKRAA